MGSPALDYDSRKGLIEICELVETIERPIEMVWSVISAFGAIKTWMPGIETCYVREDKPQPPTYGATRAVANLGIVMEETLEIWDLKEHFISYRLQDGGPWPIKGCRGSIRLRKLDADKTEVTWRADAAEVSSEAIAD
ncbi:uncharacterized protein A1O5_08934, partial [Cladophialophora psammophila CBS 110553]